MLAEITRYCSNEFKERFNNHYRQLKKFKALVNFSINPNFKHTSFLRLIEISLEEGFLDNEESTFLEHMINKYKVKYLVWSHKIPWVKNQMKDFARQALSKPQPQLQFSFDRQDFPRLPVHLIGNSNKRLGKRL